jgi:hypothetical protein
MGNKYHCSNISYRYSPTISLGLLDSSQRLFLLCVRCCQLSQIVIIVSPCIRIKFLHRGTQFNHFLLHSLLITYLLERWSDNLFCMYLLHCDPLYKTHIPVVTASSLTIRVISFWSGQNSGVVCGKIPSPNLPQPSFR